MSPGGPRWAVRLAPEEPAQTEHRDSARRVFFALTDMGRGYHRGQLRLLLSRHLHPAPPPDLDCGDIPYRRFTVIGASAGGTGGGAAAIG